MIDHIPLEDLSARLDDALPPTRCAQIDAHVAVCDACRSELASLRWTVRFLRAMPEDAVPAPAAFHVGAATAYVASDDTEDDRGSRAVASRTWATFGAIAALLVVAFGLSRLAPDLLGDPARAPGSASVASEMDSAQVAAGGAGPGYGVDVGTGTMAAPPPDAAEASQGGTVVPPPPGVEAAAGAETEPTAGEGGGAAGSDMADPRLQAVLRQTADAAVGREDDNARDPRPLATALGDDRSRRVAGIRAATATPAGGGAGITPGAERELGLGATSGVTSTMATPPAGADPATALGAEAGGYVPPDAPIPGIPRRPIVVPPAAVAPAGTVTATAAVSMTTPAATPMAVGAAVPTDQADVSRTPSALTSEGEAATPAPVSGAHVGPAAVVASPVAAPMTEGQPAARGTLPAHLFVPVITVAIALLALGVILMRQAQARRRRYR